MDDKCVKCSFICDSITLISTFLLLLSVLSRVAIEAEAGMTIYG